MTIEELAAVLPRRRGRTAIDVDEFDFLEEDLAPAAPIKIEERNSAGMEIKGTSPQAQTYARKRKPFRAFRARPVRRNSHYDLDSLTSGDSQTAETSAEEESGSKCTPNQAQDEQQTSGDSQTAETSAEEERSESKCTRNQADEDKEKSDGEAGESSGTAIEEQYLALHVDVLQQLQQGAEMVRLLQSQLDSTRVAKAEGATKLVEVENKLLSVERESTETMRELEKKKDQVEFDKRENLRLRSDLSLLTREKRTAEGDLTAMLKELENLRKSHVSDSEKAKCAFEGVRQILVEDLTEAVKKKVALEEEVLSLRAESTRLQSSLEKDLEQEKEKTCCRICLDRPRDTVCFPCLHMHFCSPCLEKHRSKANNNTCPSCRTTIDDVKVLRC
ncbi:unnamed protein product [Calypogeia fissa]